PYTPLFRSVRHDDGIRASPASPAADARRSVPALCTSTGAARRARPVLRRARTDGPRWCSAGTRPRFAFGLRRRSGRGVLVARVSASPARAYGRGGVAAPPADRSRRRVARGRAGVPGVRARLDDGGRRVPRPGGGTLSARGIDGMRERRTARAARDALV